MKYFRPILLVFSILLQTVFTQDKYSFDLSEIEKKSFQFNGYLEARPTVYWLDRDSHLTLLRFYAGNIKNTVMEYNFKAILDASFDKGIAKARLRLNTDLYYSDPEWSSQISLYEGFLSLKPSTSFQIDVGKKRLKWGKGYAWNPVAFVDNPKNPNDPDLALEGFTVFSIDYIKSFPGKLKTVSLTSVLLPIFKNINSRAGRLNTINFAMKLYALLFDTDIDFLFLAGPGVPSCYGIDFSRNITSNLEIHGEWSYVTNFSIKKINSQGGIYETEDDCSSYLLGVRFLARTNTTFFLEYYRSGKGYSRDEMSDYYSSINRAYTLFQESGDCDAMSQISSVTAYRTFTPMRDYLYLRISQKEPFDILYFTPSLTSICNLKDGSFSLVPELLYIPITNLEVRARAMVLAGREKTEFGEKQNNIRLELRIRYYF